MKYRSVARDGGTCHRPSESCHSKKTAYIFSTSNGHGYSGAVDAAWARHAQSVAALSSQRNFGRDPRDVNGRLVFRRVTQQREENLIFRLSTPCEVGQTH